MLEALFEHIQFVKRDALLATCFRVIFLSSALAADHISATKKTAWETKNETRTEWHTQNNSIHSKHDKRWVVARTENVGVQACLNVCITVHNKCRQGTQKQAMGRGERPLSLNIVEKLHWQEPHFLYTHFFSFYLRRGEISLPLKIEHRRILGTRFFFPPQIFLVWIHTARAETNDMISICRSPRVFTLRKSETLEIHTGFPPGFFFVSKTCHDALSTINRDKVSVSVFFTIVTV